MRYAPLHCWIALFCSSQELTAYHECLLSVAGLRRDNSSSVNNVSPRALSSEAVTTIKLLLHSQLHVGRALADCLSFRQTCQQASVRVPSSDAQQQFFENDQLLQGTYMQCISERLALLTRLCTEGSADEAEVDKVANSVYGFLSSMDPSTEMIALPLDALFTDLLLASARKCKHDRNAHSSRQWLCRNKLYACLLGRQEPFLIDRFCKVEDHLLITKALPDFDSQQIASLSDVSTPPHDTLSAGSIADADHERTERACAWHMRFFAAFRDGEHFLEALLVSD